MKPYYRKVGKVISTLLGWDLIEEYNEDNKISLGQAMKNGLYIRGRFHSSGRVTYMPVTDIKRRIRGSPVLTYTNGKIDLERAVGRAALYFGPSYDENAADEEEGLKDDDEKERQRGLKEEVEEQQRNTKRLEDDRVRELKNKEAQEARLKEFIEQKDRSSVTPAAFAVPDPVQSVAVPVPLQRNTDNGDAGYEYAKKALGEVNRAFYDQMTMGGGKLNKSRKPKRRNSRSNRRKTLNKSKK